MGQLADDSGAVSVNVSDFGGGYGVVLGTILTPPVRKNHRKAACKMYPTPPLAQRQRQGQTFTETSHRE